LTLWRTKRPIFSAPSRRPSPSITERENLICCSRSSWAAKWHMIHLYFGPWTKSGISAARHPFIFSKLNIYHY
jgi:hypothetical protein